MGEKAGKTDYLWDIRISRKTVASSPLATDGVDTLPQDFSVFWPSEEAA